MTETARLADYVLPARDAVREVRGDVLQLRVPPQRLPPAAAAARAARRARWPSPRSTPASSRRSARSTTPTSRRCGPPRERGPRRVRRGVLRRDRMRTPSWGSWRRSSSTARSARRCPTARRPRPSCGAPPSAAPWRTPTASRRAGFTRATASSGRALFDAILASPSGVVFTGRRARRDLARGSSTDDGTASTSRCPSCSTSSRRWPRPTSPGTSADFPFVLSAGERRSFTANTIIRDPAWRKKDPSGALRISPADADRLGLVDGGRARLTTKRGRGGGRPSRSPTSCSRATSRCRTASGSTTPVDGAGADERRASRRTS